MTIQRLNQQMAFCQEVDKEKEIFRQTYLASSSRRENDAEHAWHMAVMAMLLHEYSNEDIDLLKTIKMILIHDIVEIDAGDTYAYDLEGQKDKKEREAKAANRIFNILPEDQAQELFDLFHEFEDQSTPEARFAKAMDNVQPIMLNDASEGKDWVEKGVRMSQAVSRLKMTLKGSRILWDEYCKPLIQRNIDSGKVIGDVSLDVVEEE